MQLPVTLVGVVRVGHAKGHHPHVLVTRPVTYFVTVAAMCILRANQVINFCHYGNYSYFSSILLKKHYNNNII